MVFFIFAFLLFFLYHDVFSAPPFPGVWKKTRLGFKSEKDIMPFSPEVFFPPSMKVKSEGELRCAVILAEYQDKKFDINIGGIKYNPKDYFTEMIFGAFETNKFYTFHSFREYWLINSRGKLNISGEVFGPYTLSGKISDYACGSKNGSGRYCGLGNGTDALVSELISLADKDIDFSQYDRDNDGTVDCLIVVHAGRGGEVQEYSISSPNCCDIWSHHFRTNVPTSDGVYVKYGVIAAGISELFPYGNMGLIAHEFGHLIGLPDLYDTGASGLVSCGVGPYSLMGYGLYKGDPQRGTLGTLPSNLSPWEKIYLGWSDSQLVSSQYCDKISSTSYADYFLKIPAYSDRYSKEYFLVEFRKRENFDSDFPTDGILIWHIDEDIVNNRISSNSINTDECYPGCGNSCGEIKDREERFLTCQKHYGIRVVPRWTKSDPFIREKTNILEDSTKCLETDIQDFWVKGTRFPDSYTSAFGYRGIEHNVLIAVYSDEGGNINVAATPEASKITLKGPVIKGGEFYDWVSPGGEYVAKIIIEGTAPIFIRILNPPDAFFKDIKDKELILSSEKGNISSTVEIYWKAPLAEMSQSVTVSAENCVERVLASWDVIVQETSQTLDTTPPGSVMGCACRASGNFLSYLPTVFLFAIAISIQFLYYKLWGEKKH